MRHEIREIPLVSIVIPCYNHAQFVQESIQSVIDQDYKNIELIIIDDGSKDNSVEKIKEMIPACRERFVRFEYRHRENRGLSATLNEGIDFACGAVVGFCSSDDAFHQRKISAQVEYFNENQDSDFCFTSTYVFDDNSQILQDATKLANRNLSDKVTFKDLFTFKVSFPVTGAYRARFIKDVLFGFDESLSAEDYDINLKIIRNTKVGYIEEKLYYYRSPAAIAGTRNRPVMRLDVSQSHRRTIEKYRDNEIYKEALTEWNFRRFIYFSSYKGRKAYALHGMFGALKKTNTLMFWKALARTILLWK